MHLMRVLQSQLSRALNDYDEYLGEFACGSEAEQCAAMLYEFAAGGR